MIKFPVHACSLTLTHNDNRDCYQTVVEWLDDQQCEPEFPNPEEREKCIAENEIWTLQWYPTTPVGSHKAAASTLEMLLQFVNAAEV